MIARLQITSINGKVDHSPTSSTTFYLPTAANVLTTAVTVDHTCHRYNR